MVAEGHELGNHMPADKKYHRMGKDEFEQELLKTEAALKKLQPDWPVWQNNEAEAQKWFRPPSGRLSQAMADTLDVHGYTIVLGDVYSNDVVAQHLTPWLSDFVCRKACDGSIMIVHSPEQHRLPQNAEVVRKIVEELGGTSNPTGERPGFCITSLSGADLMVRNSNLGLSPTRDANEVLKTTTATASNRKGRSVSPRIRQ